MKLTKRKGFNFFRSYYDVYNELSDKDKVAFMDALLDRQFLGVKPNDLKGMAKFAYISQTNSIDSQVKGYEDKTGIKLKCTPTEGGCQGGIEPPTEQVEEKEKVKEKVKEKYNGIDQKIDFNFFWDLYDKKVGNKKSCAKKWNKLSYEKQSEILAHVKDYVLSTPEKQYRANPETYFNQERWNNEIILKNNEDQRNNKGVKPIELASTFGKHFATDRERS